MTHVSERHIRKFIEKLGGKVTEFEINKHCHVRFDYYGNDCWAMFPRTPPNSRWESYKYNDIRRALKARGIWRGR